MITYLACPYSDPDPDVQQRRFEAANAAAAFYMARGEHVLSPISHTHPIALAGELPKDWAFWKSYDTELLRCCGLLRVLRLDGWDSSVGVSAEIQIARSLGIPVEFVHWPLDVRAHMV